MKAATWNLLLGTSALAFLLGSLGPTIDGEPASTQPHERDVRGEVAAFEHQALEQCQQAAGENATVIHLQRGEIACVDKHGRRNRSVITVLHRSEQ